MAYVKCDDDIHKKAKAYAAGHGETLQSCVESWIEAGLSGTSGPTIFDGLKSSQRELVTRYANALRLSRDAAFLAIIETMLDRMEEGEPRGKRKAG